MELSLLAVILGFILDLIVGDPHWLYHPIRLVGHLISGLEKLLRSIFPKTEQGELIAGGFLLVLTAGITTAVAWGLLLVAGLVHPCLRFALEVIMCYWVLATKSLKTETMKVYDALKEGDLKKARFAVSMVVGRDTEVLDDIGVTKAAVETVAENASDGVIAPLLFLMIGGAPLGFFYKAVNTMDSMVGYKNDKYLYFGRAAAKFDDVLNYIPARLSGMLMCGAAAFCGMDSKMPGGFTGETGTITAVPILPTQKPRQQEPCIFSWPEMLIILENYMRSQRWGIRTARWNMRIFRG